MNVTSERVSKIERIELDEEVPVYDIEVPKNNNFTLSNGIVVHNSKDVSDAVAGAVANALEEELVESSGNSDDSGIIAEVNRSSGNNEMEELFGEMFSDFM